MPGKQPLARRMPVQNANIDTIVSYTPTASFVKVEFEESVAEVLVVVQHDKDVDISLDGIEFITMVRQVTGASGIDFQDRLPFAVFGLGGMYIRATAGGGSGDVKLLRRK